jgi:hypothetical protein
VLEVEGLGSSVNAETRLLDDETFKVDVENFLLETDSFIVDSEETFLMLTTDLTAVALPKTH